MRRACKISLTADDRAVLERWSRSRSTEARLVERSRIILLAAEGWETHDYKRNGTTTLFAALNVAQGRR